MSIAIILLILGLIIILYGFISCVLTRNLYLRYLRDVLREAKKKHPHLDDEQYIKLVKKLRMEENLS
jgi:hypothetical protein